MQLTVTEAGDTQILRVEEARIDSAVAIQFKDAVRARVSPRARRVVLRLGVGEQQGGRELEHHHFAGRGSFARF